MTPSPPLPPASTPALSALTLAALALFDAPAGAQDAPDDLDGDGQALRMWIEHPDGDQVPEEHPRGGRAEVEAGLNGGPRP